MGVGGVGVGGGVGVVEKEWIMPVAQQTIQTAALTGTTLTADQQNALERRKQEEQYMLVRQRELAAAASQQQQTLVGAHPAVVAGVVAPPHALHQISAPTVHPFPASPAGFSTVGGGGGGTFVTPMHGLPLGVTHHVHSPAPVQVQTLPALDALRTAASTTSSQSPVTVASPSAMEQRGGGGPHLYQPVAQAGRGFMSPWGQGPLGPLSPGMGVQMHSSQPPLDTFQSKDTPTSPFPAMERKTSLPLDTAPEPTVETIPEPAPESIDQSHTSSISIAPPPAKHKTTTSPPPEPEITALESITTHPPEQISPPLDQVYEPTLSPSSQTDNDLPPTTTTTIPSPSRTAPWATPQKSKDVPNTPLSLKQIQEMEAKRAAEQARRVALDRAAAAAASPAVPVAVAQQQQGLPQGSTWGSVAAKAGGWKQPVVGVGAGVTSATVSSPGKKSMAQIQREEEEERARLAKTKEVVPGLGAGVRGYAGAAAAAAASTAKVYLTPHSGFVVWS